MEDNQRVIVCLQTYLKEFQYKNTVYTDLWNHLQEVRYPHTHVFPQNTTLNSSNCNIE